MRLTSIKYNNMQYSMWIFNDDWYLHIGVNGKVTSFISYCKVILCQFGFWCVKGHLVTSQPAFVTVKRYKHSIISTCVSSYFKYLVFSFQIFILSQTYVSFKNYKNINNVYPKTAAALMVGPANTKSTSQPRFR